MHTRLLPIPTARVQQSYDLTACAHVLELYKSKRRYSKESVTRGHCFKDTVKSFMSSGLFNSIYKC